MIRETKTILVDEDLCDCQKEKISAFIMATPRCEDEKAFNASFKISCVLDEEISRLEKAKTPRAQKHSRKRIHQWETKITPAKKQKAIGDRKPIIAKCWEYFRQYGAPTNICDFIKWLDQAGVLTRTNEWGKTKERSDTSVRSILHDTFGISGKRGRKSGKHP